MRFLPTSWVPLLGLLAAPAFADVTVTETTQLNSGFLVAADDLLQAHLASTSFTPDSGASFGGCGTVGGAAFNNGAYGLQGNVCGGGEAATAARPQVATFVLDAGQGAGYDIASISSYAGWDAFRGGQHYVLSYATVDAPDTFVTLATVLYDVFQGGANVNTRVTLTGTSGLLATRVHSLRFTFDNLSVGFAGYREIDVQGVATSVPEPGTWAMGLAGLLLLGARARRRQTAS